MDRGIAILGSLERNKIAFSASLYIHFFYQKKNIIDKRKKIYDE